MGRRDEKLKSLLRKMNVSETPDSFTDEVVKEIEAIVKNKMLADDNLKKLLQQHVLTTPPSDFTYKVLNRTRNHSTVPAYKSVISNRAWIIIALVIFVIFVFSFEAIVSKPVTEVSGLALYLISFGGYLNTLSLRFFEPLSFLGIIVISASLLLALDFVFHRKYNSKTNQ